MKHQYSLAGLQGVAKGKQRGRKPRHNWTSEKVAIAEMLADGLPVAAIAERYKVEQSALYRQLPKIGLQTPNQCVLRNVRENQHVV